MERKLKLGGVVRSVGFADAAVWQRSGQVGTWRSENRVAARVKIIVSGSLTCVNPLTKLDLERLARLFLRGMAATVSIELGTSFRSAPGSGLWGTVDRFHEFALVLMPPAWGVNIIELRLQGQRH
jgi:hypothetical protein